ncbi:MAG: hypothetical protein HQL37_09290 [Alphaproteobacteria bacterium]|nr:hypothetical protein [Alphaproteobacteria bacterium]
MDRNESEKRVALAVLREMIDLTTRFGEIVQALIPAEVQLPANDDHAASRPAASQLETLARIRDPRRGPC